MRTDQRKMQAAVAACDMLAGEDIIGIGSGSTVACFIQALADRDSRIEVVPASEESARLADSVGLEVRALNDVGTLDTYIDGADEATMHRTLIKGGGGALAREKVIASASRRFICIIDDSKMVDVLGKGFALPVEVLPMASAHVARKLVAMGGTPQARQNYLTDNGNTVLDVSGLKILDPRQLEYDLNQIAGVVCNGLFAARPADVLLVADGAMVETISA